MSLLDRFRRLVGSRHPVAVADRSHEGPLGWVAARRDVLETQGSAQAQKAQPPSTQEADMRLSPNFLLSEMTATTTGLENSPGRAEIENLRRLCLEVLEPWRVHVGPLKVNSGFRSEVVNEAVGGSSTSEHRKGLAADVVPVRTALPEAWHILVRMVEEGLPVSQAIVYVRAIDRGWIHVGLDLAAPIRGQLLVQTANGAYYNWGSWGNKALVLPSG